MTQREYFKAIGWEDCPYHDDAGDSRSGGWSFREDLNGKTFPAWRSKDGMGWTNATTPRGPREEWNYEPQTFADVPHDQRYRYRKVECPICRRRYAGWFVQQPKIVGTLPFFEIYDTSYWNAYNDEPSDKDREGVIAWSRDLIVEAAREFIERHPERFVGIGP